MPEAGNILFPYGIRLREDRTVDAFPAARISFAAPNGEWLSLFLAIDSGAAISALPKSDAFMLGVRPEDGLQLPISGVSGRTVSGWRHSVRARIGSVQLRLPVVFLNGSAPRVLGRAGVFSRFSLIFEEEKQRSALLKTDSRDARTLRRMLDEMASDPD